VRSPNEGIYEKICVIGLTGDELSIHFGFFFSLNGRRGVQCFVRALVLQILRHQMIINRYLVVSCKCTSYQVNSSNYNLNCKLAQY